MAKIAREKICGIYKITNNINKKVYIGQSKDIYTRWTIHKNGLNNNRHHNEFLQSEWNKYEGINFSFNILEICTEDMLDKKEKYYINLYNSTNRNFGYNLDFGGIKDRSFTKEVINKMSVSQMGRIHSDETKQKIGDSHRGKIISEETKEKLRESHKRENLSQTTIDKMSIAKKGKPLSEEHRKKLSEAGKNRIVTEETRKKLSKSNMGHEVSVETREKLRIAHTGKKLSEESKQKVKDTRIKKSVLRFNEQYEFICEYDSTTVAGEKTDTPVTNVSACCKGKRKTYKGNRWCYKEDFENKNIEAKEYFELLYLNAKSN